MLQALSSSPTLVTGTLGARELGVALLGPRAPPRMGRGCWVTSVMGAANMKLTNFKIFATIPDSVISLK
jgi:hypothetical protein